MSQLIKIAGWSDVPRAAVIFVHGLGGHPYDTWRRSSGDQFFWPSSLAKEIPGLTVWTLAYEAPASNWLGTAMPLQDRAKNVLEHLVGESELRDLPILFVCHSLGGLLIKQVLRAGDDRRAYDAEARTFIASVKGIVFIATPHSGSMHATILDKLRLTTWPSASTLDLVKNNASLRNLNVWYRNWSGAIRHKVFYEKQGTSAGVIVADDSSDPGLLHVDPVGIDADHRTICKPAGTRDLVYSRTRDFIADTLGQDTDRDHGTLQASDLPQLPPQRWPRMVPIALRLAILIILAFVFFIGLRQIVFPPDVLGTATVAQIEGALRNRSPPLTTAQVDQFLQSLRALRGDPSFAQAIEEARKGNTRVAEGIWRQIYEDREKTRGFAQKEQAEAARNLAATAITNNVAEGLSWFRKAVALEPDDMAGQFGLGDAASAGGTLQEAGDAFRRYIELARRTGDEGQLFWGLIRYGDVQVARDDRAGALKTFRDGLAIAERMAKLDPSNTGWQRNLVVAYFKVGQALQNEGDVAGAVTSFQESFAIVERLAKSDPRDAGLQLDLSASLISVGDLHISRGDLVGALKFIRDGLAISERLAKLDPNNAGLQRHLAHSFIKVGDAQSYQSDFVGALKSYRDAHAIAERLARLDPSNAGWQHYLALSFDRLGRTQWAHSDFVGALASHRDGIAIVERLAKSDPDNAQWQHDLTNRLSDLGLLQAGPQRDLAGALTSFSAMLAIAERQAKSDPGNPRWQSTMAGSLFNVGHVQVAQGDLAGALKSYRDSVAIQERLVKSLPTIAPLQSDLSMALSTLGNVQETQGDFAGALKSYRESVAVAERLVKLEPGNPEWQRYLVVSYTRVAQALSALGDKANALDALRAAREIAVRLAFLAKDHPVWRDDLSLIDRAIQELSQ